MKYMFQVYMYFGCWNAHFIDVSGIFLSAFLSARQLLSKKRGLFMRYFYRKIDPQNRNSETKKAFRRLSGKPEIPYFFSKKALTFSRILLYWYLFRNRAWDGSSAGMSVRLTPDKSKRKAALEGAALFISQNDWKSRKIRGFRTFFIPLPDAFFDHFSTCFFWVLLSVPETDQ